MDLKNYFGDSKILITGASGFVGRNLYEYLQKERLNVIGTCFSNENDSFYKCDLTDKLQVEELFDLHKIDYVFLVAAKTYGAATLKLDPASMVRDTIEMNNSVLEQCLKHKVKNVLYISSSVTYQESFRPLSEEELDWNQDPLDIYMGVGWVKRYIEKLCQFYNELGLPVTIVRPTNIYGKYDKYAEGKSHVVPAITKRIVEKQNPLIIWGNGNSVKDFIFIDDFLRDILKIFIFHNKFEVFNLCSGKLTTIRELVETLLYIQPYQTLVQYDETKPTSAHYKAILRNKFDSILGKEKQTCLKKGLKTVVDWMKKEIEVVNE